VEFKLLRSFIAVARALNVSRAARELHQFHQCSWTLDGPRFSEPVRVGCHGRGSSDGGGLLRQSECGTGALGGVCEGLAVVERTSTPGWGR
jgi:hypothetical protein